VIVGDIKVDEAIAQTAKTFGALPKRKPRTEIAGARESRFPAATPQPVVLKHKGRPDQGIAAIVWPTTGYWKDPIATEDARVLAMVMNHRAMDELREKQGKSYGVGGGAGFDKVFPDYGSIMLQTEISQEAMPAFFEAVDKIAADLRASPPTQDELDRAVRPAREGLTRSRLTNGYWASVLTGIQLEPRRLDDLLRQPNLYDKVTPASVQKAAQTWLVPAKAWKATVIPDVGSAATAATR
jgi:zinc protease